MDTSSSVAARTRFQRRVSRESSEHTHSVSSNNRRTLINSRYSEDDDVVYLGNTLTDENVIYVYESSLDQSSDSDEIHSDESDDSDIVHLSKAEVMKGRKKQLAEEINIPSKKKSEPKNRRSKKKTEVEKKNKAQKNFSGDRRKKGSKRLASTGNSSEDSDCIWISAPKFRKTCRGLKGKTCVVTARTRSKGGVSDKGKKVKKIDSDSSHSDSEESCDSLYSSPVEIIKTNHISKGKKGKVAPRTRSKGGRVAKNGIKVRKIDSDLSDDGEESDSSYSSESELDDSDDEDFIVEDSEHSECTKKSNSEGKEDSGTEETPEETSEECSRKKEKRSTTRSSKKQKFSDVNDNTKEVSSKERSRKEKRSTTRSSKKREFSDVNNNGCEECPKCGALKRREISNEKRQTSLNDSKVESRDDSKVESLDEANVEPRNEAKRPESEKVDDVEDNEETGQFTHEGQDGNIPRNGEEVAESPEKTENPAGKSISKAFCKSLFDRVLGNVTNSEIPEVEAKQPPKQEDILPRIFRFEDDVDKPVEKSEFEIMIELLFAEMESCLHYGYTNLTYNREVEEDNAETSQYVRCSKGNCFLIEEDEKGLFCKYCGRVELEAKHIMPPWAERTHRRSTMRRFSSPERPNAIKPDGLNFEPRNNPTGGTSSSYVTTGTIWDVKPGTKQTMYEHQQEGLEFLWKNLAGTINLLELQETSPENSKNDNEKIGGCIISHAPGTGKTRLTMVFIETYLKVFPKSRPLIIAPASMLLTWEEEFKKWEIEFPFHNMNSSDFSGRENKGAFGENQNFPRGKLSKRAVKIFSWNEEPSVLGMSYNLFESLAGEKGEDQLRKILLEKPGLVVLDEGHTARNQKSKIWQTLLKVKTDKRIILSGTPFQNNFEELRCVLELVRPVTAATLKNDRVFSDVVNSRGAQSASYEYAINELKKAMTPFVHVHKGSVLLESLPGLRDCALLLTPPPLQKSLIERLQSSSQNTFKFEHKVALTSVHPYLINNCKSTEFEKNGVDLTALEASKLDPLEGVKTNFIMEMVRLSIAKNEKVLVFSQYISPLKLLKSLLKKIFGWSEDKQILIMQGKMKQKRRQRMINAYNDPNSQAKVLLASTKCCSEGINLVGASRVVLLDVVWNPSVERQAISRAYRLGQKKIVYTYHLMTSGTTEGSKYIRQAEKEKISELVFISSTNEKKGKDKSLDDGNSKDELLEDMIGNATLQDMFEKIVYQPKEQMLIESFSVSS